MKIKIGISGLLCMLLFVAMLPTMAFAANEADIGGVTSGTSVSGDSGTEYNIKHETFLEEASERVAANKKPATWDGTADTSWYDLNPDATEFYINSAEALAGVAVLAKESGTTEIFKGKTLNLTTDIDLNGHLWTPIWMFKGTFNGGGHTIYNMHVEQTDDASGLFGWLFDATVKDLMLDKSVVVVSKTDDNLYQGILAGLTQGTAAQGVSIENCGVLTGSLTFNSKTTGVSVSGLIGSCKGNTSLHNCWSFADVETTDPNVDAMVGGLVGQWEDVITGAQIIDSYFGGTINVAEDTTPAAGILGAALDFSGEVVLIRGCVSYGRITTPYYDNGVHIVMLDEFGQAKNCMWRDDGKAGVYRLIIVWDEDNPNIGYADPDPNFDDKDCGEAVKYPDWSDKIATLNANAQKQLPTDKLWAVSIEGYPVFANQTYLIRGDYYKVAKAKDKVPKNGDLYTDESWDNLENVINKIYYHYSIDEQAEINKYPPAILKAIDDLKYKDADYTAVDAAIEKAEGLNKEHYIDFSDVDAAIEAVVRGKDITEQAAVDEMAKAIEDAIDDLEYKDADYTAVNDAIDKADALDKTLCKDFSGVEDAIAAVDWDKNITEQDAVDDMAEAINAAIEDWRNADEHTLPDVWENDENWHWKVCKVCGTVLDETEHTWNKDEEDKAPTCTSTGIGHKECEVCGYIEIFEIDATGHLWDETKYIEDKAPTCTEEGSKSHHCENCDATKDSVSIPVTEHTESAWITDAEATCTKAGSQYKKCTVCGTLLEAQVIDATGHSWDDGKITKQPTCKETGVKTYTCDTCGETKTEVIPKTTEHTASDWITDAEATCTKAGSQYKECTVCGTLLETKVIDATGHSWDDGEITKQPTCKETGMKTYTCTCDTCKATKTEVIPKTTEHTASDWITDVEATCTTAGSQYKKCTVCGTLLEAKVIDATGHSWDDGKITKQPTCKETGVKTYTCDTCGETKTEVIPKTTEHTASDWITDAEATCTKAGSQYKECTVCGTLLEAKVIDATGHSWDDGEITKQPTCKETGVKTYTCDTCGETKTEVIPKTTEHTESAWITDAEASCTKAGSQHKECNICGTLLEAKVIDATGHSWDDGEITKQPTCKETGVKTYTCDTCGETKTEDIPKTTEHTESAWIVDAEADCVTAGSRHKECETCGKLLETEIIPAKTHTFDKTITKEATCEEAGYTYHICKDCGYIEKVADIKAEGHTYGETITKAATCEEAGYTYHSCTVCGYTEKIEDFEATGHTESTWIIDAKADCVTAGSRHKECETCGKLLETEVIPATGHTPSENWETDEHERWKVCTVCGTVLERIPHTFGELIIDEEPSCTEPGRGHRVCAGCGYEEEETIEALGHSWESDYTVDKEPTCTTDGSKSIHCQNCDATKDSEVIPATGHTPSEKWETDEHERWKVCTVCGEKLNRTSHTFGELIIDITPTCTKSGRGHRICSGCGYKEYEAIKALGHSWDAEYTVDVEPTCTTDGSKSIHCQNCDEVKNSEVIPATGHTPSENWETDDHERWKVCTVCGTVLERITHTFGELIIDEEPSCTESGRGHRVCAGCGYEEEETIEALGHTPSENWETDDHERWKVCTVCGTVLERIPHTFGELIIDEEPSCTEPGRGHRVCAGCGYEEEETIEALGHSWESDYTVDKEPTCTTDGSKSIHCQNCDATKDSEVIPATGHTESEWIVDAEATCTASGSQHKVCTVCEKLLAKKSIPATGHSYGGNSIHAATCEESGYTYHVCGICGYTEKVDDIKAKGHIESDWIVDAEAGCITAGSRHKECETCGKLIKTDVIEAKEHHFGKNITYNAACATAGYTYHICTVCGFTEKVKDIDTTGHTWKPDQVDKAPTCTETGIGHRECAVCGHVEIFEIAATGQTEIGSVYYEIENPIIGYYFSHDYRSFNKGQLGKVYKHTVNENGVEVVEKVDVTAEIDFADQTPEELYKKRNIPNKSNNFEYDVNLYINGEQLLDVSGNPITVKAYIGVKGDVNLDHTADAVDASFVLSYYAKIMTGKDADTTKLYFDDENLDNLSAFLCDVTRNEYEEDNFKTEKTEENNTNGSRVLDSVDASFILSAYAKHMINPKKEWHDIWTEVLGKDNVLTAN